MVLFTFPSKNHIVVHHSLANTRGISNMLHLSHVAHTTSFHAQVRQSMW